MRYGGGPIQANAWDIEILYYSKIFLSNNNFFSDFIYLFYFILFFSFFFSMWLCQVQYTLKLLTACWIAADLGKE